MKNVVQPVQGHQGQAVRNPGRTQVPQLDPDDVVHPQPLVGVEEGDEKVNDNVNKEGQVQHSIEDENGVCRIGRVHVHRFVGHGDCGEQHQADNENVPLPQEAVARVDHKVGRGHPKVAQPHGDELVQLAVLSLSHRRHPGYRRVRVPLAPRLEPRPHHQLGEADAVAELLRSHVQARVGLRGTLGPDLVAGAARDVEGAHAFP
mmetsp:Transcript_30963/g.59778  ORF Transcript_30963/g.59778 Transcript_30963/m.59778 type:complete len:204 (+) Transcript_30963:451-1062(+)